MITGYGGNKLASGERGAFYNTLEEFHKYWERIDIITPGRQTPNSEIQTSNLFSNVFIHSSDRPLIFQPWFISKKGAEIYKKQKFDLVTVHEYPPFYNGIGARMLWNKIKIPYILEIHHIPGYPRAGNLKEKFYKNLMKLFIKPDSSKASVVRVVNKKQVPEFLIRSGVPKRKIMHISSMYIDLDVFKPMNLDKKYDLIFIGRLTKNKGVNLFLDTVRRLRARAVVVGEGPERKNLEILVAKYNIQDSVLFHGWAKDAEEIARLMNQSKILIMPSYNEGGPRVVPEAMACGVPVLATNVGIVPDIVKDKESGRIIDWDSKDITDKARELLNNEFGYNKYSRAGIEIVKQFEKKEAIKNYAEKLKFVISRE